MKPQNINIEINKDGTILITGLKFSLLQRLYILFGVDKFIFTNCEIRYNGKIIRERK
jgi:hypothetical protein